MYHHIFHEKTPGWDFAVGPTAKAPHRTRSNGQMTSSCPSAALMFWLACKIGEMLGLKNDLRRF